MALGLRSRWGGQVPVPPGPRYGQACDQRAALPQPRVGPKRDESWASRGVDRAWPASDHSSDTWEFPLQKPRGATQALSSPWGLGLFFRAFPVLLEYRASQPCSEQRALLPTPQSGGHQLPTTNTQPTHKWLPWEGPPCACPARALERCGAPGCYSSRNQGEAGRGLRATSCVPLHKGRALSHHE